MSLRPVTARVLSALTLTLAAGCAGGGGCAGLTPLPTLAPMDARTQNAMSLHVTTSGFDFLGPRVGAITARAIGDQDGVIEVTIPESGSFPAIVCPASQAPCVVEVDLIGASLGISSQEPSTLRLVGTVPVRIKSFTIELLGIPDDVCTGSVFSEIPVDALVDVTVDQDPSSSTFGLSRLSIARFFEPDVYLNEACGLPMPSPPEIYFFGEELLEPELISTLEAKLPEVLGLDGALDLGALVSGFSYGTEGALQLLAAAGGQDPSTLSPPLAWGDLHTLGQGAAIGVVGAAKPLTNARCVKPVSALPPSDVPMPQALFNPVPGWPSGWPPPHLGMALSERFVNHLLANVFNAGALCLGITADSLPTSAAGLFVVDQGTTLVALMGAASATDLMIGEIGDPRGSPGQLAIQVKPGAPPEVVFGSGTSDQDPSVLLRIRSLSLDFLAFSYDRFLRFLTATLDLDVPIHLTPTPQGITPSLGTLAPSNVVVTNATLLREQPAAIAKGLAALLSSPVVSSQVKIPPVDPGAALAPLGLDLHVPSGGVQTLSQGEERYLGIFGVFGDAPSPGTSGSCSGCAVIGNAESTPSWIAIGAMIAALILRRSRRMRRAALGASLAVACAVAQGCSCIEAPSTTSGTSSGGDCKEPCCKEPCTPLSPGIAGAYLSAAAHEDTLWIAAYADRSLTPGATYSAGDLVVKTIQGGVSSDFAPIDGVPEGPAEDPRFDPKGYRGGQTAPGDDVGLWTSTALDDDQHPMIAYYDRSHRALKLARYDGATWSTHTVEAKEGHDIGRYAKLIMAGGKPVIAYPSVGPGGEEGALIARVRVARSSVKAPSSAGDWSFEDVAVDMATPCRQDLCPAGEICMRSTQRCSPPPVPDGDVSTLPLTYPDAIGGYVALAQDPQGGLAIAYYDRPRGDLVIAYKASGSWVVKVADGADGDVGLGAALAVDPSGTWHLAYVDGRREELRYVQVSPDKTVGVPEVVDDGYGLGGAPFADGKHIVGDDPNVFVAPGGEIHIAYQDATAGTLRRAIAAPSGGAHVWSLQAIDAKGGSGGAFPRLVAVGGALKIVHFVRRRVDGTLVGDVEVTP